MVIFKQQFKKILFSWTTFIIGFVTLFIVSKFLSSTIKYTDAYFTTSIINETITTIFFNYNTLFIWFFFPMYISFNSVKFISDEIHDGTFLTVLSKPVSRSRILIEKFLATQLVNMLFATTILGYIWFNTLSKFPIYELWDVMVQTLPTTIYVTFLVQLFLTLFLVIISLKLKPSIMTGVGFGISLFAQLAPSFLPGVIQKNGIVQREGTTIDSTTYATINKGQNMYKKFFRPFMYIDHMQLIYWESIADKYSKYGVKHLVYQNASFLYNREAVFKKIEVEERNLLGQKVKKEKYLVKSVRPWIDKSKIKIYYFIGSLLLMLFGFIYFSRKDIV